MKVVRSTRLFFSFPIIGDKVCTVKDFALAEVSRRYQVYIAADLAIGFLSLFVGM